MNKEPTLKLHHHELFNEKEKSVRKVCHYTAKYPSQPASKVVIVPVEPSGKFCST